MRARVLPRHIVDLPDSGITCVFYETTERVVMITRGGLEAASYSWDEFERLLKQSQQERQQGQIAGSQE